MRISGTHNKEGQTMRKTKLYPHFGFDFTSKKAGPPTPPLPEYPTFTSDYLGETKTIQSLYTIEEYPYQFYYKSGGYVANLIVSKTLSQYKQSTQQLFLSTGHQAKQIYYKINDPNDVPFHFDLTESVNSLVVDETTGENGFYGSTFDIFHYGTSNVFFYQTYF
jgi:hypothetical protein